MQLPISLPRITTATSPLSARLGAALFHLILSLVVAGLVAILVLVLWYPHPYRTISGGRELFLLIISVDVVLGPLLTAAIFNVSKPRSELRRDIAVVALLQLAGLAYGLWTVQLARPVHVVFEYDRFRVVHRIDIPPELEHRGPPGIKLAPWNGPNTLALRPFRNSDEQIEYTLAALQGLELAARPDLWEPYATARDRILSVAKPAMGLKSRFPGQSMRIEQTVRSAGRELHEVAYLPLIARASEPWTVLLDARTAEIVGYLPLDSF